MHGCSNHIQHEGKTRGLYVVTHECTIPYSTCRGVLSGLYPHCCNSTTSVVSDYYGVPFVSKLHFSRDLVNNASYIK